MTRIVMGKLIVLMVFMTTFWFSSKPADVSSSQSKRVLIELRIISQEDIINKTPKFKFWKRRIRKIAHFSLYALIGAGAFLATGSIKKSILIVVLIGSMDEMHQYFIPGRGAQVKDVLLDTLGGTSGVIFTNIMTSFYRRYNRKLKIA